MPILKPTSDAATQRPRRDVERTVHQFFLEHAPDDYRRTDRKLRRVALVGAGVFVLGLGVGEALGRAEVTGIGAALGLVVFGVALFKASGHYKRALRGFIVENLDADGTLPFCPQCRHDLRGRDTPRATCPRCGAAPWRFAKPDAHTRRGLRV